MENFKRAFLCTVILHAKIKPGSRGFAGHNLKKGSRTIRPAFPGEGERQKDGIDPMFATVSLEIRNR
jgi:hypothetical protein